MANPIPRRDATRTRRTAAILCIAVSFAAIAVHGRTSRPAQPHFAKPALAETTDRPAAR